MPELPSSRNPLNLALIPIDNSLLFIYIYFQHIVTFWRNKLFQAHLYFPEAALALTVSPKVPRFLLAKHGI